MRKRRSYEDAVAQFESLSVDERRDLEAIKAARDRVRSSGRKVTRESVREEAACARELAILYMGLLEALESAGGRARHDEDTTTTSSSVQMDAKAVDVLSKIGDNLS